MIAMYRQRGNVDVVYSNLLSKRSLGVSSAEKQR